MTLPRYDEHMAQLNILDYQGVSDLTGIKTSTLRVYLAQAEAARERGEDSPSDFPAPDTRFGQSPAWFESTIERWLLSRPGRGAGGGRRRKVD